MTPSWWRRRSLILGALLGIGILIIIDGVGSIILYLTQRWYEHAVRVFRCILGIIVLYLTYCLKKVQYR